MRRGFFLAAAISVAALGYACGEDNLVFKSTQAGGSGGSSDGGAQQAVGVGGFADVGAGGTIGEGGACAEVELEPELDSQPADIVFIIDNSGSMNDEIDEIETNINDHLANVLSTASVDYRVIMLTSHGGADTTQQPAATVCITQPLSSTPATDVSPADGIPDDCDGPPGNVNDQFYHFDVHLGGGSPVGVQSTDALCILLETLQGSDGGGYGDEWDLHPGGWIDFLREDALKVFVLVTDDRTYCTVNHPTFPVAQYDELLDLRDNISLSMFPDGLEAAMRFEQFLTTLAPEQFGTPDARKYVWYSIVGLRPNPDPAVPYTPLDSIQENDGNCAGADGQTNSAYAPNETSQYLSVRSGGLRFPVCATGEFDGAFSAIADNIIGETAVPCDFDLPAPPGGETPDLETLELLYGNGDSGLRVDELPDCELSDTAYWIDETVTPNRVHLCLHTCERIRDALDQITVRYSCEEG